ncbi:UDP-4-amino-4,6-dideoxy-N-acetyl-beta-L-altrosamine N-acetyltransferase [Niallia sp. 01092]|uniref:UDP-4-amino-4, 6-dideoxy-N-acetyl-beta-L-altrosamine N-acetyltransferase n=1 Tax=unclassified Niallia TaxID=2837522 RepID=UPI003FD2FAE1
MNVLDRVYLQNVDHSHFDLILKWRNQEYIRRMMLDNHLITLEEHEKWFQQNIVEGNSNFIMKILYLDQLPIGVVNINILDAIERICKWGFYIGDSNAPNGLGKVMGYLALNFIFNKLHMNKLYAEVLENNSKSIAVHKKLGFSQDRILNEKVFRNEQYINVLFLSISREGWTKYQPEVIKMIEGMIL